MTAVELLLRDDLEARGWRFLRRRPYPRLFTRELEIAPFFALRIVRRRTSIVADGYIGLISFPFENMWRAAHPDEQALKRSPWNHIWLALNVANFSKLRGGTYIESDNAEHVQRLGKSIAEILDTMPQDKASLREAIRSNTLADMPLTSYALSANPLKIEEFRNFELGNN